MYGNIYFFIDSALLPPLTFGLKGARVSIESGKWPQLPECQPEGAGLSRGFL